VRSNRPSYIDPHSQYFSFSQTNMTTKDFLRIALPKYFYSSSNGSPTTPKHNPLTNFLASIFRSSRPPRSKTPLRFRLKALLTTLLAMSSSRTRKIDARVGNWRDRAVYQVLTDRFAGGTGVCETERREYCGGTWRGLEERLGYIQGMGFDAVCSPSLPLLAS
jgi:hypothetical protein